MKHFNKDVICIAKLWLCDKLRRISRKEFLRTTQTAIQESLIPAKVLKSSIYTINIQNNLPGVRGFRSSSGWINLSFGRVFFKLAYVLTLSPTWGKETKLCSHGTDPNWIGLDRLLCFPYGLSGPNPYEFCTCKKKQVEFCNCQTGPAPCEKLEWFD